MKKKQKQRMAISADPINIGGQRIALLNDEVKCPLSPVQDFQWWPLRCIQETHKQGMKVVVILCCLFLASGAKRPTGSERGGSI